MKKDIEIPIAKNVYIAMVREWNESFLSRDWNAYIINNRPSPIDMVLIVSKGYDDTRKTATMRHGIGRMEARSYEKIELVQEEVLSMDNEFYISFFADDKLYEKKYVFPKNTVNENNLGTIPLLDQEGILAQ
jgi:hypothetical protein